MADTKVSSANLELLLKGLKGNEEVAERRLKDLDHSLRSVADAGDRSKAVAPVIYREIIHWIKKLP